jgi:hypothetical protein
LPSTNQFLHQTTTSNISSIFLHSRTNPRFNQLFNHGHDFIVFQNEVKSRNERTSSAGSPLSAQFEYFKQLRPQQFPLVLGKLGNGDEIRTQMQP